MRILLGAAIAMLSFCALAQEVLLETNFGEPLEPVATFDGAKSPQGMITGKLPKGWSENSSGWCEVYADCVPMEEGGLKFLRFDVKDVKSGQAQFCRHMSPIAEKGFVRFTIKYRNVSGKFEAGLRLVGAPYEFLKKLELPVSKSWTEQSFVFKVEKGSAPIGVWINFGVSGAADVASLKIERLDEAQLIEESRRKYPDGGPANLLLNPVLPSGLQTGWLLNRELSDDEVSVAPDPKVIGPSGCPALKVASFGSARPLCFMTEAFKAVYLPESHVFSVRCKGPGTISLGMMRDSQWIGHKDFGKAGDDWRVVSFEYKPELCEIEKGRIVCKGDVWIDAFEVAPLSKAGGFLPAGKAIASLSLPPSDASCSKVQFEDERPLVDVKAFGEIGNAVLKAKATDLYGTETALEAPALSGNGALKDARLDFSAALKERPFGCFRVEAWLERDGKPVSPVNEIVVYRLRRPLFWGKDAPESPFGVHTISTTRHILMAKSVGANWTRLHDAGLEYIGWWNLEQEKGQWRFFDREIKRFRDSKVMIYGELSTAPKWASYYQDTSLKTFGYWDKFFQPKNLSDFESYVKTVVSRYKGSIDHWDIWNEPWNEEWWAVSYDKDDKANHGYKTSKEPERDFAALSKSAYTAAKEASPNAYVNGFNSTVGAKGASWTKGVLDAGGLDYCDGIAYHDYQTSPRPGDAKDPIKMGMLDATESIAAKCGGKLPKPLWMTEGSCFSSDTSQIRLDYGLCKNSLPFKNTDNHMESSDVLCKYMLALSSYDVRRWFLYSMHCFTGAINVCSILVTPDGQLHPSGAAHSAFAWLLEGRKYVKTLPLEEKAFVFLFSGRGKAIAVLSGNAGCAPLQVKVPAQAEAFDLYGNKVKGSLSFDGKVCYLAFDSLEQAEAAFASPQGK